MSAISEINKVWIQKFPGSSLPEAWAEDVKTNLSKHKKRVLELEEELEQEKVYVGFLEDLLAEVVTQVAPTTATQPDPTNGAANTQDIDDVIKDTLERRSLAAQFTFLPTPSLKPSQRQGSQSPNVQEAGHSIESTKDDPREGTAEDRGEESPKPSESVEDEIPEVLESNCPGDGTEQIDRDHFVTVIEVNGFHKKAPNSSSQGPSKPSTVDPQRLKKVPPRPPPKCFKRQGSDTPQSEAPPKENALPPTVSDSQSETSDSHPKVNGERPVIFDSRKLSAGNGLGLPLAPAEETLHSESTKPQTPTASAPITALKRFEGSKLPLPGSQQGEQDEKTSIEKDQRTSGSGGGPESRPPFLKQQQQEKEIPGRSKILDLVNRMESSQKPAALKNSEPLTPRRSFRKQFQGPVYHSVPVEPSISDYVDPCDAEFDITTSRHNDQIYDSPPEEEEEDLHPDSDSPRSRLKTNTLDTRVSDGHLESRIYPDNEPMYGKYTICIHFKQGVSPVNSSN